MSDAVVILIFSHKPRLAWYEEISLRQCCRVLGQHPIRLVCPVGLDLSSYRVIAPNLQADFIPPHWLASLRAYNRLKILPWLYRRYAAFDYILTYELDAFVFHDELLDWCAKGWDYIGAPWFEAYTKATPSSRPIGVGNAGFFPSPHQHHAPDHAFMESNPTDVQCVLGVAVRHRWVAERTLAVAG